MSTDTNRQEGWKIYTEAATVPLLPEIFTRPEQVQTHKNILSRSRNSRRTLSPEKTKGEISVDGVHSQSHVSTRPR